MTDKGKVYASPARRDDKMRAMVLLAEARRRKMTRQIWQFFPDTDSIGVDGKKYYRRELYQKHLQFFRKGRTARRRLVLAANRVGKTHTMGLYELTLHMIGEYPSWWEGRRFLDMAPVCWSCTDKNNKIRDNLIKKLLGEPGQEGTGLIPKDSIIEIKPKSGVPGSVDYLLIKHSSGGQSRLTFKSYEEGKEGYYGEEIDIIHLDEEPPYEIYEECCARQLERNGMIMLTFTPLEGLGKVTMSFLNDRDINRPIDNEAKCVIMASWDDVPHLSKEALDEMLAEMPPHQRDARSKGIPALGAGVIYPFRAADLEFDPKVIWKDTGGLPPDNWKRCFALDPGWNVTAVVWGAIDPLTDKLYIYDEYYGRKGDPLVHSLVVKQRGDWIPGVIDPAAVGSTVDGKKAIEMYRDNGLPMNKAVNAVDTGINTVSKLMMTGKLFVSKHMTEFWKEFVMYMRVEKNGKFEIKKEDDHLMDAMRYLVMSGRGVARVKTVASAPKQGYTGNHGSQGWMA